MVKDSTSKTGGLEGKNWHPVIAAQWLAAGCQFSDNVADSSTGSTKGIKVLGKGWCYCISNEIQSSRDQYLSICLHQRRCIQVLLHCVRKTGMWKGTLGKTNA